MSAFRVEQGEEEVGTRKGLSLAAITGSSTCRGTSKYLTDLAPLLQRVKGLEFSLCEPVQRLETLGLPVAWLLQHKLPQPVEEALEDLGFGLLGGGFTRGHAESRLPAAAVAGVSPGERGR